MNLLLVKASSWLGSLTYEKSLGFCWFLWFQGYFGLNSASDIPELIGTLELPDIPFSCISVLKRYSKDDMTYKMFSRAKLDDGLLDQIFR